jgi:predicted RecA/RadA family phage recombinase
MEKRNFTRVIFSAAATIKSNDQVILGDIANVSLKGLFIKTGKSVPKNMSVDITVYTYPKTSFNLHADIVRRERNGVGLQIKTIDMQSFVQLRNVVAMQSDNHNTIIEETFKMTDCIH